MSEPKPGDKVSIVTEQEQFEGTLMKRPEILDQDVTIVKLDSGYNIGIENKKIKKIDLIEKYSIKPQKAKEIKRKNGLPSVTIISTGGTIASKVDYKTGGVYADYTAEDFIAMCQELENIANLKAKKAMNIMSEDMVPSFWLDIAKEIEKEINSGADGIVITHGTDTLHFTASALSFFLKDLSKPVILTAAQRSIDRGSSDAFMNLVCSVTAAAKSDIAEVMTCMHGTTSDDYCLLIRGTKVRKMHTSRRDAFRPINDLPLAKIYENGKIEIINQEYRKRSENKTILDNKFETKTALIQIYPGLDPEIFDFYIKKGYKGLVISATALGHVPTESSPLNLIPVLKKVIDHGISVVIASQTLYGRVHPLVYTNLRKLSIGLQCIFVEDMLPETAYIKLGWVLAHTANKEKIKEMMLTDYNHEMTERTEENNFLY
jgi:glutamyl-tRNA(Gln) amidotransferase subunit D